MQTTGVQQAGVLGEIYLSRPKDPDAEIAVTMRPRSPTWSDVASNMLLSISREMLGCVPCIPRSPSPASPLFSDEPTTSDVIADLGLYQLFNIATKLALFRGTGSAATIKISRQLKRIGILMILIFVGMGSYTWATLIHGSFIKGCWYDVDPSIDRKLCQMTLVFYVGTGFGFTTSAMASLLGIAANMLLLGAGYATIMCLQLSASWISRFEPLRLLKVEPVDEEQGEGEGERKTNERG
jgi:hypothetical protein